MNTSDSVTSPTPDEITETSFGRLAITASKLPALMALIITFIMPSTTGTLVASSSFFTSTGNGLPVSDQTLLPAGGRDEKPKICTASPGPVFFTDLPLTSQSPLPLHTQSSQTKWSPIDIEPFLMTNETHGPIFSLLVSMT